MYDFVQKNDNSDSLLFIDSLLTLPEACGPVWLNT